MKLLRGWKFLLIILPVFFPKITEAAYLSMGFEYTVRASSELQDPKTLYSATNLIAPSLRTAWCEGVEGDGIGQWIELTLKEPIPSNKFLVLEIVPGYAKSVALFENNGRPKKIEIEVNGTAQDAYLNFEDRAYVQEFIVTASPHPVKKIRLKILETYPGALFSDTCVSEVVVKSQMTAQHWEESLSNKESKMLIDAFFNNKNVFQKRRVSVDSLEFAMRLVDGMYAKGAEGGETLRELYLDGLIIKPKEFVWVLDRQKKIVFDAVTRAIISPSTDKYSNSEIREAIQRGLSSLDQPLQAYWQPLLAAYSITMKMRKQ